MPTSTVIPSVFPFVTFTNLKGKQFCLPRDRIIHTETYSDPGSQDKDPTKTYVHFENPNPKGKGPLYAVVDMPLTIFRDQVLRPAYESKKKE